MADVELRKGMPPVKLTKDEFQTRYLSRFTDPAFAPLHNELAAIFEAAWDGYSHSRKSPHTRKAGAEFADPDYDLSVDWLVKRLGRYKIGVSTMEVIGIDSQSIF